MLILEELKKNHLHSFPETNSFQTLEFFEDWILFISNYYCHKNTIQPYELEDLRQYIRIRLLEQLPKIKANFKGESKLRTYISAIVLNLCREFRKKNCSKSVLTKININEELDFKHDKFNQVENNIAIKYEIRSLNNIILMYGTKSAKVKLALKLYYDLEITQENILDYCQDLDLVIDSSDIVRQIKEKKRLKKKEALVILTDLFNRIEEKSNSTEATRKWIARLIEEILTILNRGQSNHTKETLGLLLEMKQSR